MKKKLSEIFDLVYTNEMNKRGQVAGLSALPSVVIAVVVGFVTLAVGALIMDNVLTQQTANSAAANATSAGLGALSAITDFGSTMGVIAAAAILLALIGGLGFFLARRK